MKIYLNHKYIDVDRRAFEKMLPGNLEGKGVFETMRLYGGVTFAFGEHINRLKRGLKHFHMSCPLSEEKILQVVRRLIKKTKLDNARVRVIVWKESKKNISISLQPLKLSSSKKYNEGFNVVTAAFVRNRSDHSHIKTIDYKMMRAAFFDALKNGFDEAIVLNSKGDVVETTRANIFFIKNKILYTPAIECGCLNGITRQRVIACAHRQGIQVQAVHAKLSRLLKADEAFLTGSTLELMPVRSINKKMIGKKRPGPVTTTISKTYKEMVSKSISSRK
jgi:branched-subunit amino acid aminotransferase/4-amino-4-deoxychorismate lyase